MKQVRHKISAPADIWLLPEPLQASLAKDWLAGRNSARKSYDCSNQNIRNIQKSDNLEYLKGLWFDIRTDFQRQKLCSLMTGQIRISEHPTVWFCSSEKLLVGGDLYLHICICYQDFLAYLILHFDWRSETSFLTYFCRRKTSCWLGWQNKMDTGSCSWKVWH